MAIISFKDKNEFISYLLKHRIFFGSTDQLVFEFDFYLQEFMKYFSSSDLPSKTKNARLSKVYFKRVAYFSLTGAPLEFGSLTLKDCICDQGFILENAHIYGDLRFDTLHSFALVTKNCILDKSFNIKIADESVVSDIQLDNVKIKNHLICEFNATGQHPKLLTKQPDNLLQNRSLNNICEKDQKILETNLLGSAVAAFDNPSTDNLQTNQAMMVNNNLLSNSSSILKNNSNQPKKMLSTNSSVLVAPLLLNTTINGNFSTKINISKLDPKPLNLMELHEFTHIATNNAVLYNLNSDSSYINGNIELSINIIGEKTETDAARLYSLPNYQYLAANSAIVSTMFISNTTIRGNIKETSRISHPGKTPYAFYKNKYLSANSGIISLKKIDKTSVRNLITDINPESTESTNLYFRSKEDFQRYLMDNLKKVKPIVIGSCERTLNLNFDFSLDDLYSFITNQLSLSIDSLSFCNVKFNKKLVLSDRYRISVEFDNCEFSSMARSLLSKIVPQYIDIQYHNEPCKKEA